MPALPGFADLASDVIRWLLWLWQQPGGQYMLIGAACIWLLLCAALLHTLDGPTQRPKVGQIPIHTRRTKRWPWANPGIPFQIGDVTIDLQPRSGGAIHMAIGGTSGTGKTSATAPLLDLPIGVLTIALDNTRPIANRIRELPNGIEWTNEPGVGVPWNMLNGSPELVTEALIAGWPRSDRDTGHYRRIARMRMWDRLERADKDGEVRTLPMLIEALLAPSESSDAQVGRACRDWATKLAGMYRILGAASIGGPGDLDLVQAMRQKKKVLMRLNRFLNPEDAPTLGGMLLVHARRVAQEANVPFVLIIEEAGLMEDHQQHIGPLAQASRDRDVSLVIITQNLSQLPLEVRNNISAWLSFAQEDDREQLFVAKRLHLTPKHLWREAFKDEGRRWAYLRAPGIPTQLVHIKEFKPAPVKIGRELDIRQPVSANGHYTIAELPEIDGWQPYLAALPAPMPAGRERPPAWVGFDVDMNRFWKQMRRTRQPTPLWSPERGVWWDESGCLEWKGPLSKPKGDERVGRPRSNIGRRSVTVYVETAKAAGKIVEPTWDHCCDWSICVDPEHGYACTIAINNANRHIRSQMLERAWMDRCGFIPEWWSIRGREKVTS